ncbi:MAG: hypothetical protein ACFFB3_19840 [Candidatus Hodarchaeota archaeon]
MFVDACIAKAGALSHLRPGTLLNESLSALEQGEEVLESRPEKHQSALLPRKAA